MESSSSGRLPPVVSAAQQAAIYGSEGFPQDQDQKLECFADISSVEQSNSQQPAKSRLDLEPERDSQRQFEEELDHESLLIENDRLKTTVFILNQKIKVIEDGTREADEKLQGKIKQLLEVNRMFETELEDLAGQL